VILADEKDSIGLAVSLANTWDTLNDPPEILNVDRLRILLRWFELEDHAAAATERDLPAIRDVRSRIRRAFQADTEADAVAELNTLARRSGAVPQLVRENGGWFFRYGVGRRSIAQELGGRGAVALLRVIEEGGWGRFGLCAAAPCCCVYVDRSRNRSRRYCCSLCADRATQAAARRRKREQAV
jgi:predicted RNA-binding Zn ribbon-like protein